ncbi:hypothetical protein OL229_00265 [Neisseriaceae bacterium JH1-16]|nr:hypothetical protein [Neisseriaceae bacterium JH1-16]
MSDLLTSPSTRQANKALSTAGLSGIVNTTSFKSGQWRPQGLAT